MRGLVVLISMLLALGACRGKENAAAGGEATETIAPAQPQPEATGTDAMTQTVELGDGRSVSEGGALAEGAASDSVPTDTSATTSIPATTATAATPPASTTTR